MGMEHFSPPKKLIKSPLKLDSYLPKIFIIICFNDSPSKIMKNAFYFILKALFVLKIFRKNDLIRKIRLISKFMTSQPG